MLARAISAIAGATLLAMPALADPAAEIEARVGAFEDAYGSGDPAAVADLYTADAMAMPPGGPIVEGRDGITQVWRGAMEGGLKALDLTPLEIEVQGDTAYEVGEFAGTMTSGGAETTVPGKYIVVWRREDGEWRLHRDIWNMSPTE